MACLERMVCITPACIVGSLAGARTFGRGLCGGSAHWVPKTSGKTAVSNLQAHQRQAAHRLRTTSTNTGGWSAMPHSGRRTPTSPPRLMTKALDARPTGCGAASVKMWSICAVEAMLNLSPPLPACSHCTDLAATPVLQSHMTTAGIPQWSLSPFIMGAAFWNKSIAGQSLGCLVGIGSYDGCAPKTSTRLWSALRSITAQCTPRIRPGIRARWSMSSVLLWSTCHLSVRNMMCPS
mmetsp:Transcript_102764/g.265656  ORF Transcript_102764/g.265656 Transcript_102764/m.265656 type:complete len:236 (-) Transcript_102764:914-1621(-)